MKIDITVNEIIELKSAVDSLRQLNEKVTNSCSLTLDSWDENAIYISSLLFADLLEKLTGAEL